MDNIINKKLHSRHSDFQQELKPDIVGNNVNLNIGVTNRCNCDCVFCFSQKQSQARKSIDLNLAKRLLEEGIQMGITEFNPYGNYGDPFLCEDIFKIVSYAKKLGYKYIFTNTNGILLNKENARKAIDAGFDSIRISINAGTPETYSKVHGVKPAVFNDVIENLIYLDKYRKEKNKNIILSVSFVMIDYNQNEVQLLKDIVSPYIDDFLVFSLMNPRYAFSDMELLQEQDGMLGCAKKDIKGCNRVFNSIYVNQEGFMTVCALDEGGFGIIDDVNNKSLKEAWNGDKFQAVRMKHINNDLSGFVCGNCLNCEHNEIKSFYSEYSQFEGCLSYSLREEAIKRELLS